MRVRFMAVLALALIEASPINAFASSQEVDGRAIYNFRCYFCHGYSGNAKTVASSFLVPPPADFTRASTNDLPASKIEDTVRRGRPGTAMKSFASIISETEIKAVAAFVFDEFVVRKAVNTRYHTAENGWPDHQRHAIAFPFATGEISLDQPWDSLSAEQARGRRLFMETCITCHDRGTKNQQDVAWDSRPISYPRNNFSFTTPPKADTLASASPYAMHDIRPPAKGLSRSERRGEKLFQANCSFCHAADGTGKNWIGSFLEPHPRNLRDPAIMSGMSRERFIRAVGEGLENTSMPAWKHVLKSGEISDIADYVSRVFHPLSKNQGMAAGARD